MKTVIAFFDYTAPNKPSLTDLHEIAQVGQGEYNDYVTTKQFLDAIKEAGKKGGFTLKLKNVVVA